MTDTAGSGLARHASLPFFVPATEKVLIDVSIERRRQDAKWGVQTHPSGTWALILGEEFGEACKASLDVTFDDEQPEGMTHEEFKAAQVAHLRYELIQTAAVAVSWVEAIDREG